MKQPEPFGKFLLYGQVAVGGMAEIYKARYADPAMPQVDIALKRILPSYTEDEGFVTMFKDEGNIAIKLKHPNIVNIYEVGEVNNDWYIAMEYIYGSDLRVLGDACEKYKKRFTDTQIARIVCDTAKALDYAHSCTDANGTPLNIVHRDCTPHNIMVSHDNTIKLMDFGIAKAASRATKTRVGTVKGKSSYMSPEQARGKQLDGRSDMFTLGTVAWEMLTGYRLFKASSDFEILSKVLKQEIIHPSDLDSNIPRSLGDIVMKTLERDRDRRYETCGALASALESWLSVNGDGSDARLGEYCMALTNKKGHAITELPDYVRGASLYRYEEDKDEKFVPIGGNRPQASGSVPMADSNSMGGASGLPSGVPNSSGPTAALPAPNGMMPQPGFPSPMVMSAAPTSKVPMGYIVLYSILFCLSAIILGMAFLRSGDETKVEDIVYKPAEALVTFKSHSVAATVTVNGEKILTESGEFAETPIYSNKRHLGDKMKIVFEREGYEPVTLERDVVFLQQDIEVDMMTTEEARLAKMTAMPTFVIKTVPEGATIKVNGEDKGKSPVTLENIEFGKELRIEASLTDYSTESRVYVASRDSEKELRISMESAKSADKVVEQRVVKKSSVKSKSPSAAKVASGVGKITVKAKPWGVVMIDGSRVGNTTTTKEVKSGSHKVEINLPNKNLKVSKSVTVKPNQTVTVGYDFNAGKWM